MGQLARGSCFPDQAASIGLEAGRRGIDAPLLRSITPSNQVHQAELVEQVGRLIGRGGLVGANVAVLGLAFKANTDDVRESPALAMVRGLRARGATVRGYDPVAAATARRSDPLLDVRPDVGAALDGADAVLVATEWSEFAALDWAGLAPRMRGRLVYDTRRICSADAVRAAGLRYVPLGRSVTDPAVVEPAVRSAG